MEEDGGADGRRWILESARVMLPEVMAARTRLMVDSLMMKRSITLQCDNGSIAAHCGGRGVCVVAQVKGRTRERSL